MCVYEGVVQAIFNFVCVCERKTVLLRYCKQLQGASRPSLELLRCVSQHQSTAGRRTETAAASLGSRAFVQDTSSLVEPPSLGLVMLSRTCTP